MMKKCLVLDLDNTLWGGIVGEDGINGLSLSLSHPGNGFIAFQQAILDLYNRGVILAINSRNNPDDALAVIRNHPNMILKEHHFAAQRINWQDKATNIRELAMELNIGLDSMVFLDDDPMNRELVSALVPEVAVPEMPSSPAHYARFLNGLECFPKTAHTNEDLMRGSLYVTERLRMEEEKRFANKEDFLLSLGLKLFVSANYTDHASRLAQLTEKTNQFNNAKSPLSVDQIIALQEDGRHLVLSARLEDSFGDHGIIALAIIEKFSNSWQIDSLLLSCRVFGRGVEDALLSVIATQAESNGARLLTITFTPSEKNEPARAFVERCFVDRILALDTLPNQPYWLTTEYENI